MAFPTGAFATSDLLEIRRCGGAAQSSAQQKEGVSLLKLRAIQ